MNTRNLTILLTDIKGFTDKSSHKTRAEIQQMLDKHKELVLPILQSKGGQLVKTIGDAFLMTFESPTDAVLAGVQVQDVLRHYNADKDPDSRIEIRIAINQGEVNLADNDVFGEPVNITARIEAIAEANEVFFTDAVYLAMNKKEVPSSEVGLLQLKGIPEKVRVYKVKRENPVEEASEAAASGSVSGFGRAVGKVLSAAKPAIAIASPAVAQVKLGRPALLRRAGAVLIDACLVGVIISNLWPGGDNTEVRVRKHRQSAASAAPTAAEQDRRASREFGMACKEELTSFCKEVRPGGGRLLKCLDARADKLSAACASAKEAVRAQEAKPSSALTIDDSGIHAPGVSIDDNGIHAPGVSIDDNGIHAPGVSIDDKGVRIGGLAVADGGKDKAGHTKTEIKMSLPEGVTVSGNDEDEGDDVYDQNGWSVRTIKKERRFPRFSLVWLIYSVLCLKWLAGTTVGGKICRLTVVSMDGKPVEKRQRWLRTLFSLVSGWCAGLGYLWALWEKDGRGWHDLIAGTRVVSQDA